MNTIEPNSNIPTCTVCRAPLEVSAAMRNSYYPAVCKDCKISYAISPTYGYIRAQKRFKHENTVWNMTYRFNSNQTIYVSVQHQDKKKNRELMIYKDRIEHVFDGMVLPERFIQLIAFLSPLMPT